MTGPTTVSGSSAGPTVKRLGRLDQPGEEGVVDPVEHDHPRAGRALLAGVAEGALEDADDRLVEVGVVVDDDRVLAPHLGDHPLDVVLARRRSRRPGG